MARNNLDGRVAELVDLFDKLGRQWRHYQAFGHGRSSMRYRRAFYQMVSPGLTAKGLSYNAAKIDVMESRMGTPVGKTTADW